MRPVMPLIIEVSLAKFVVLLSVPTQKSVGVDSTCRLHTVLPNCERVVAVRVRLRSFYYGLSARVFQHVGVELFVEGPSSHLARRKLL